MVSLDPTPALFVTDAYPFPPTDGREITNAWLLEAMAERYPVDLLELRPDDEKTGNRSAEPGPSNVTHLGSVSCSPGGAARRGLEELLLRRPSFFYRQVDTAAAEDRLRGEYRFAWASPVGCLGFLRECEEAGVEPWASVCLGLNDVQTTLFLDSLRELRTGRIPPTLHHLGDGLRTLTILLNERRYLADVDLVHVQTPAEAERLNRITTGLRGSPPQVIVQSNGRNPELEKATYRGVDSDRVLLMTRLTGRRRFESTWFLEEVWPRIRWEHPEAELLVVDSSRDDSAPDDLPEGATVRGFVDDLASVYESAAVAVVPIAHGTGFVNRCADALTAGVPLVATPEPASTLPDLTPGDHALVASTPEGFSEHVTNLLGDREARLRQSERGRAYARSLPTKHEAMRRLVDHIDESIEPPREQFA